MSVLLSEITITNDNNVTIEVTLEVPVGEFFTTRTIEPKFSLSISVRKEDVQSVKLISIGPGHDPDYMIFDLGGSGKPYRVYIEKIEAVTSIGVIQGSVSSKF